MVPDIHWQINTSPEQEKAAKTADDPQIPQPDLRFAKGSNSKATKEKGPGPNTNRKSPTICHRTQREFPTVSQNMQKSKLIVYIHQ